MRLLSCENATEPTESVCPSSGLTTTSPVSASQTRIVLSDEPETMRLLSCENATELTPFVCPPNTLMDAGQWSALPVAKHKVFGYSRRYCFATNEFFGANGSADR